MKFVELEVSKINPSVFQPRETFAKEELEELAKSLKENGLLNPIHVRKNGDDTYQIIAGERRWRAAQMAGFNTIFAFVKEVTLEEQRIESLIENIHRKDLSIIEKGRGMMEVFKVNGITNKSKELSNILNVIERKKYNKIALSTKEKDISDIYSKIHANPRTIKVWLDAISVEPEIIEEHLKTPEEERISETTISRLSTIKEPELQKKTYIKIKNQELGQKKASEFVTKIKKLPEVKQEIALTTDIPIEVISEETDEEEIKLSKKELEIKIRQRMAQKALKSESRLSLMDREIPAKMIDEIYVGDIECPECGDILSLIHCEPGKVHKIERKPS